jgi:hypothetical protein
VAAVGREQDVAAFTDSHRAFAPAVHIQQQGALGQARDDGVTVDRMRGRLGQAGAQEEHRNPAAWPN